MTEKVFDLRQAARDEVRKAVAEILPKCADTISRAVALKGLEDLNIASFYEENEHSKEAYTEVKAMLKALPPTQPNLSEAYSKAVFTWLMDYQIRAAELNGRYTPYEVLSWVINDWRKENG